jgi:hypothetical protein
VREPSEFSQVEETAVRSETSSFTGFGWDGAACEPLLAPAGGFTAGRLSGLEYNKAGVWTGCVCEPVAAAGAAPAGAAIARSEKTAAASQSMRPRRDVRRRVIPRVSPCLIIRSPSESCQPENQAAGKAQERTVIFRSSLTRHHGLTATATGPFAV